MIVIQYLAPSHLPMAAEGGWNSTKVTKKREIERLRSSGVASISWLKPGRRLSTMACNTARASLLRTLSLCVSNVRAIKTVKEV
jgi:hypothetical protein